MPPRALVLGGGGVVGIAWEAGVLAGLAEGGVRLARSESLIGTSAGSLVGAWLGAGRDVTKLAQEQAAPPSGDVAARRAKPDPATLARIFSKWMAYEKLGVAEARELGALALAAPTAPEERSVGWFERELGPTDWPPNLRVTAVDAANGELRVFDAKSGVPLVRAVAASCCVPGIFAPVTIGGRRYVDGGVRSGTHAALALEGGAKHVVVLTPMARGNKGLAQVMQRLLDEEIETLRAAGAEVTLVAPTREEAQSLGLDYMDPGKRPAAVQLGLETGRRAARQDALTAWR
jgi:NTE family protein